GSRFVPPAAPNNGTPTPSPSPQGGGERRELRAPHLLLPHNLSAASAARSPDSHAPPTVPHSVSCPASPAKNSRSRTGSIRILRPPWPFTPAAENAPSANGSAFQRVAWVRPIAFLTSAPNSSTSQPVAKLIIAASPDCDSSAPNLPPTSIMQSGVPDTLASSAAVRVPFAFSNTRSSLRSCSGLFA